MRWLFLLLLMLNAFYYVWHQQEAPPRAKEILPLSLYKPERQNIQLVSEGGAADDSGALTAKPEDKCLFLGGPIGRDEAVAIEQRLNSLDVQSEFQPPQSGSQESYWLKIAPESRRLVDQQLLATLVKDFPLIKNRIMSCSGIATADQFD